MSCRICQNMNNFELPSNPAQLAETIATENFSDSMEISDLDHRLLTELEVGAEALGFLNKDYFVESGRALILPASFQSDEPVLYTSFFGLSFEGRFATYAKVHIGRIIGGSAVRAVCLAFTDVTLLPYFETVPDNELVFVPVLAINSMEQTSV